MFFSTRQNLTHQSRQKNDELGDALVFQQFLRTKIKRKVEQSVKEKNILEPVSDKVLSACVSY